MRILLVGGGTAGHLFPLVAVARRLSKDSMYGVCAINFIIADNDSDKIIIENAKFSYNEIPVAKLRRYFSWKNFRDFFRFIGNIFQAITLLRKIKPEKIFSKGGFVSLPVGIAAKILRIPFVLHETDSVMGLSNTILSKFCTKILTGFPTKNSQYIYVGNPVREEFFRKNPSAAASIDGSKPSPLKILIFGGSQGAVALNNWARKFFFGRKEKVLLVTGKGKLSISSSPAIQNITEVEFLFDNFIEEVQKADIVITRSGGSIFELAAAKKCVILVPLPGSANDHQRKNAQFFAEKNAALWLEEENLYSAKTEFLLEEFFASPEKRKILEENISPFADKNAVEKICEEIVS